MGKPIINYETRFGPQARCVQNPANQTQFEQTRIRKLGFIVFKGAHSILLIPPHLRSLMHGHFIRAPPTLMTLNMIFLIHVITWVIVGAVVLKLTG